MSSYILHLCSDGPTRWYITVDARDIQKNVRPQDNVTDNKDSKLISRIEKLEQDAQERKKNYTTIMLGHITALRRELKDLTTDLKKTRALHQPDIELDTEKYEEESNITPVDGMQPIDSNTFKGKRARHLNKNPVHTQQKPVISPGTPNKKVIRVPKYCVRLATSPYLQRPRFNSLMANCKIPR